MVKRGHATDARTSPSTGPGAMAATAGSTARTARRRPGTRSGAVARGAHEHGRLLPRGEPEGPVDARARARVQALVARGSDHAHDLALTAPGQEPRDEPPDRILAVGPQLGGQLLVEDDRRFRTRSPSGPRSRASNARPASSAIPAAAK